MREEIGMDAVIELHCLAYANYRMNIPLLPMSFNALNSGSK